MLNQKSNSAVSFEALEEMLQATPRMWLITGVAGFIGSNLLEALLKLNQRVVGLDNFSTGYQRNLDEVRQAVGSQQWKNFTFLNGDIRDSEQCRQACEGVEFVLHQAALGSVPRSLVDPLTTNAVNVSGFLTLLEAARQARVRRFVYAASSSTYGDHPGLPKVEESIGRPLSPYAVTKYVNELYADVYARSYGFDSIGLRYFNVFGPRQDPEGAYAAVIPKWISSMIRGQEIFINGDGQTSRDFCHIRNVVQANLLAATSLNPDARNQIFNIAVGERTTLNELHEILVANLTGLLPRYHSKAPVHREFREGDVLHSLADVSKARRLLGYYPTHDVRSGLELAMSWYLARELS